MGKSRSKVDKALDGLTEAEREVALSILTETRPDSDDYLIGHIAVSEFFTEWFEPISETLVRRWRKANAAPTNTAKG